MPRTASTRPIGRRRCPRRPGGLRPVQLGAAVRCLESRSLALLSTLHVGELLRNQPVADPEDVHAPDVAVGPRVAPALHDPIGRREGLLRLEGGVYVVEDRLPGLAYRVTALMAGPRGGGAGGG